MMHKMKISCSALYVAAIAVLAVAAPATSACADDVAAPVKTASDSKAAAPAKKDADKNAARSDAPSLIEMNLIDIQRDETKIFSAMEAGELSQEDFERKIVELSYHYDEMISRDPHNITTLVLYGKFLRRIGKSDQANVMFVHADHLSPNIAVLKQQLGNYMAEQGNYPVALVYYMKAIDLAPKESVYHYGLGELLFTFRDKFVADGAFTDASIDAETLSAFARAVELDPKNKDFAFRHAEAYYDIKTPKWEEALALWTGISQRKDLTQYDRDAVRLHMAKVNCELGRNKAALELLREDVTPMLQAARARLLKRINAVHTSAEDKANGEVMAPAPAKVTTPPAPPEAKGAAK